MKLLPADSPTPSASIGSRRTGTHLYGPASSCAGHEQLWLDGAPPGAPPRANKLVRQPIGDASSAEKDGDVRALFSLVTNTPTAGPYTYNAVVGTRSRLHRFRRPVSNVLSSVPVGLSSAVTCACSSCAAAVSKMLGAAMGHCWVTSVTGAGQSCADAGLHSFCRVVPDRFLRLLSCFMLLIWLQEPTAAFTTCARGVAKGSSGFGLRRVGMRCIAARDICLTGERRHQGKDESSPPVGLCMHLRWAVGVRVIAQSDALVTPCPSVSLARPNESATSCTDGLRTTLLCRNLACFGRLLCPRHAACNASAACSSACVD
mmetsp:Transcript_43967/g.87898  ORF Transcript_43967/g.87898 Transcript_43967/m.87898 type:complete len:317 (-) Transcript_43967:676-1626(-)